MWICVLIEDDGHLLFVHWLYLKKIAWHTTFYVLSVNITEIIT